MNPRAPLGISSLGQPTTEDLEKWHQEGTVITCKTRREYPSKATEEHKGKITSLESSIDPTSKTILRIEGSNSKSIVYIPGIIEFTYFIDIESIFVEASENPVRPQVVLKAGNRSFCVDKHLICERSDYFKALLDGGMQESNLKVMDLSDVFCEEELEAVLSVLDYDGKNINSLTSTQEALYLFEGLNKIAHPNLDLVKNKIIECIKPNEDLVLPGLVTSAFMNNLQREIFAYSLRENTKFARTLSEQFILSQFFSNGIELNLTHTPYCYGKDNNIRWCENEITNLITLLQLSDIKIKSLTIKNLPFSKLSAIFESLSGNTNIEAFTWSWPPMNQPHVPLEGIQALLTFMGSTESLTSVSINTEAFSKEAYQAFCLAKAQLENKTQQPTPLSSNSIFSEKDESSERNVNSDTTANNCDFRG